MVGDLADEVSVDALRSLAEVARGVDEPVCQVMQVVVHLEPATETLPISVCVSVCLSVCLCLYVSVCLSVSVSVCLSLPLSLSLSL